MAIEPALGAVEVLGRDAQPAPMALVRSFISIPSGVLEYPIGPYTVLTLAGSAIWCFAFAGAGWALGSSYESVHHAFRYVDVLAVVGVVAALVAMLVLHRRRTRA